MHAELRGLLAARYQGDLLRAVAGVEQDVTGCAVPSLGESYVSPAFRVRPGGRVASASRAGHPGRTRPGREPGGR